MGENKSARKPGDALIGIGTVVAIVFALISFISIGSTGGTSGTGLTWLFTFAGLVLIGLGYMQRIAAK